MLVFLFFAGLLALANAQKSSVVAFSRGLLSHQQYHQGEIVQFNKDITNINAQFTSDGKFQVQVPGIYSFHFYTLSQSNSEAWLEFYKNEEYLVSAYAYTDNDWAAAGNTVILELQAGDLIYVKATDDYDNALYGTATEMYTTFTGELIFSEASGSATPVAFTAGLSSNITYTNAATVMFDKVLANAGNGYDPSTGKFTAPQTGTYMIHLNAISELGTEMWLDMYKNDQYIESAYAQAPHTWADAGNSVILDLNQGDTISIRSRPGETVIVYGQPGEIYCTLSGVMLSSQNTDSSGQHAGQIQAFSAGAAANLNNDGVNTKAAFNHVFTNHGNGYDPTTGVFTAKVAGVYVFNYHGLGQQDEECWLEIYKNNQYVNSLYGHALHGWAGGSNSVALQLSAGDTVYVDMKDHNTKIYGANNEIYSTFSGYLLAHMSASQPVVG